MKLSELKLGQGTHCYLMAVEGRQLLGLSTRSLSEYGEEDWREFKAHPSDTKIKVWPTGGHQDTVPNCSVFKAWKRDPGTKRQFLMRTYCGKLVDIETGKFVKKPYGPFTPLDYKVVT